MEQPALLHSRAKLAGCAMTNLYTIDSFGYTGTYSYIGVAPGDSLAIDAAGDLYVIAGFYLTNSGPSSTIEENKRTPLGFNLPSPMSLPPGTTPAAATVTDSAGDIFGESVTGGAFGNGYLYEIAAGAATPTVVFSFAGGESPIGGLVIDSTGDVFGLTANLSRNPPGAGQAFELPAASTAPAVTITGTAAGQNVTAGSTIAPFAGAAITAPGSNPMEDLTVQLSDPAAGTLSNLSGGVYDAAQGTYTIQATLSATNSALQGLVFIPSAGPATTTTFTIDDASGPYTAQDGATSVTTAGTASLLSSLRRC